MSDLDALSVGNVAVEILKQAPITGILVWYLYYTQAIRFPAERADYRESMKELIVRHDEVIKESRTEYLKQIKDIHDECTKTITNSRKDYLEALVETRQTRDRLVSDIIVRLGKIEEGLASLWNK